MPLFILRRVVRCNPWLLADAGKISRNATLDLGIITVQVNGLMTLRPAQKAKLLVEREAGTLFPKSRAMTDQAPK